MANIGCKSSNKEKLLLKVTVQRSLTPLRAAAEQFSITLNELP